MFDFIKPRRLLGGIKVIGPLVGNTGTFITCGAFETEEEALNCEKYLKTKFARGMLAIKSYAT